MGKDVRGIVKAEVGYNQDLELEELDSLKPAGVFFWLPLRTGTIHAKLLQRRGVPEKISKLEYSR
jgi:hypothetical protein